MISDSLKFYEFRRQAVSILYPNYCPFCGELIGARDYYCELCIKYLPFLYGKADTPEHISHLSVVCRYAMSARTAVLSLKYGGLIYAADAFGLLMSEKLKRDHITADILIPVPSGFLSMKKRGFATGELLAKRISLRLNIPYSCIVAARDGKVEQKRLSQTQRRKNAENSFYLVKKADVSGKRVILVDDVTTTGSTLSAIAKILLDAGAADVKACVFAQTVHNVHRDTPIKVPSSRKIPLPKRDNGIE